MTDAPRKRPWLQFHLSTLIVLTFVAAGLLWLNMTERIVLLSRPAESYGWPVEYLIIRHGMKGGVYREWSYGALVLDASTVFMVLLCSMIACEWFIRRRERRP